MARLVLISLFLLVVSAFSQPKTVFASPTFTCTIIDNRSSGGGIITKAQSPDPCNSGTMEDPGCQNQTGAAITNALRDGDTSVTMNCIATGTTTIEQGGDCTKNQNGCGSLVCRPLTGATFDSKTTDYCLSRQGSVQESNPCILQSDECAKDITTGMQLLCATNPVDTRRSSCQCPVGGCVINPPPPNPNPNPAGNGTSFNLCNQANPDDRQLCTDCSGTDPAGNGKIWTAVGCIDTTTPQSIINDLLTLGLGLSGGVVLLSILAGAFMFATSAGEPKRVQEAQEMVTATIVGLLFIIFSVIILQFFGISILHLPGFGTSPANNVGQGQPNA